MRDDHKAISDSIINSFTSSEIVELINSLQRGLEAKGDYVLSLLAPLKDAIKEVTPMLYKAGFQATLVDDDGNHITIPSNIEFRVSEVKDDTEVTYPVIN